MSASDNPRAFPSAAIADEFGGMTQLDWFAGQALPGVITLCVDDTLFGGETRPASFARKAYEIADAMMAERERRK